MRNLLPLLVLPLIAGLGFTVGVAAFSGAKLDPRGEWLTTQAPSGICYEVYTWDAAYHHRAVSVAPLPVTCPEKEGK